MSSTLSRLPTLLDVFWGIGCPHGKQTAVRVQCLRHALLLYGSRVVVNPRWREAPAGEIMLDIDNFEYVTTPSSPNENVTPADTCVKVNRCKVVAFGGPQNPFLVGIEYATPPSPGRPTSKRPPMSDNEEFR
ncbi:uncharacterized protein GLRG_02507 [Colletotrichum graminicola M1.001]|uniref:Uncharacterized protein n=1 Tax=Colletotrichum graminicola (strain M1.001 / M2 / FGSC 10212) TaxID=645133 RepID=E3Q749_COLGM|nr:uncharacterized protein GLRG_02507 [Colletotrichum graminicola M1.001]EFQ26687.1 hypothetical protein GLRG_02507 [Colletotrichum graminicola M1.001]